MSVVVPPGAEPVSFALPAGTLHALDAAPVGDPVATAVLVPGYTGSKEDFLSLLEPLTDAGFRVVAYDQRGQHESTGPDDPAAYNITALAAELLALIEVLGVGPVHVVGHSFGGLVARAGAIRSPRSFRSLTLLDSGPSALGGERAERVAILRPVLLSGGTSAVWDHLVAASAGDEPAPADVGAFLYRRFHNNNATGLRVMGDELVSAADRTKDLRDSGVRVLVAYGDSDDAWAPATQHDMATRLGASEAVIAGAVHSPAVEQPAATAGVLLDFWRGAGPGWTPASPGLYGLQQAPPPAPSR